MGPHPAVAEVRRAVRRCVVDGAEFRGPVLVACSGGSDSLALAAALAFEAPRAGLMAGLVTIDHGLQEGSAAQAARVAELGGELGLDPVRVVRVEVAGAGGPEASARRARYAALDRLAGPLEAVVLLGHTLDDQAETVLLGLGRGSGANSIAGMRAVDGRYRRPLLGLRRATTRAACAALGLVTWDDPHNTDSRFRRVRIRQELLPLFEDVLAGGVAEALARTAALLREDQDGLAALAAAALDRLTAAAPPAGLPVTGLPATGLPVTGLPVAELGELPAALRSRVLKAWAERAGAAPLSAGHVAVLGELVTAWHGQGPIPLPGGLTVVRASGTLWVSPVRSVGKTCASDAAGNPADTA
jgi:tRNA(Ile)-lysidine synthase